MITRDIEAFAAFAAAASADFGPPTAARRIPGRARWLPPGRAVRAGQCLHGPCGCIRPERALAQHRDLQRALSSVLPTICFAGDPATPDALFPNNVFGTAAGRYVVGRMRHQVRQREATRGDIRNFFGDTLGYRELDLSQQQHPCELTGALVIDRARGLGFCGLSRTLRRSRRALDARRLRPARHPDVRPGRRRIPHQCRAGGAGRARGGDLPGWFCRPGGGRRNRGLVCAARDRLQPGRACGLRRQLHHPGQAQGLDERGGGSRPAARPSPAAGGMPGSEWQRSSWMRSKPPVVRCVAVSARFSDRHGAAHQDE